jgi:hypothetical protein
MVTPVFTFEAAKFASNDSAAILAVPEVLTVPAVPEDTYPAETVGVIDLLPD